MAPVKRRPVSRRPALRVQPGRRCKPEGSPPTSGRPQPPRFCTTIGRSSMASGNSQTPSTVSRRQSAMRRSQESDSDRIEPPMTKSTVCRRESEAVTFVEPQNPPVESQRDTIRKKLYCLLDDYKQAVLALKGRKEDIIMGEKRKAEVELEDGTIDRRLHGQIMNWAEREEQINRSIFTSLEESVNVLTDNGRLLDLVKGKN